MDSRSGSSHSITTLLLEWQSTADECHLESLVRASSHLLRQTARAVLIRHRVADPAAIDDAVSLVLDHLRRLPGVSTREREVARFKPRRSSTRSDPGKAFLVWLSKERARDVARSRRARARHIRLLSQLEPEGAIKPLQAFVTSSEPQAERVTQFRRAIEHLQDRQALVIQMLVAGQSQTAIAAELRVCEGTVSRLRTRAVAKLREVLQAK
jgi:RNA polymerase sigma factor (sigma-70 family)